MPQSLLAYGHFTRERTHELEIAAAEAGLSLELADPTRSRALPPRAVLVDADGADAERCTLELRLDAELGRLPVIALRREIDDLAFDRALSWSADDLVRAGATNALVRRLRRVPTETTAPDSDGRERALIADPDRRRRIALARPLRRAGYSVTFAATAEDIWAAASQCSLVVSSEELHDNPHDQIARARFAGTAAPWIVTVAPRGLGALRRELADLERVAVTDAFAPPDSILFVANELAHAKRENQRASTRILYGTTVAFRGAGRDDDDHGHSYNVSQGGLYVRTLAPPDDDHVWLELRPPRQERRVRLVGEVAWRCSFRQSSHATAPPGFGVRIVDGARADLEAWRAGCVAFAEALG